MSRPPFSLLLSAILLAACGGEPALVGLDEPIRVPTGTFKPGELPGSAPGSNATGPRVTILESANNALRPGQAGKAIGGRTTTDASAVGVRLEGRGTGYWVLPVGAPDPQANGELTFSVGYDVAHDAVAGPVRMLFAAIAENGSSGTQEALDVCITRPIPDNLNACDSSIEPPDAVLSLDWDTAADVDLVLVTPSGKVVDAKHPTTAPPEPNGTVKPDKTVDGILDRDGNGACAGDQTRRENVVWQAKPEPGTYLVYANLYSACGADGARFTVTLHLSKSADATFDVVEVLRVSGRFIPLDANGGSGPPLYVTAFEIQ